MSDPVVTSAMDRLRDSVDKLPERLASVLTAGREREAARQGQVDPSERAMGLEKAAQALQGVPVLGQFAVGMQRGRMLREGIADLTGGGQRAKARLAREQKLAHKDAVKTARETEKQLLAALRESKKNREQAAKEQRQQANEALRRTDKIARQHFKNLASKEYRERTRGRHESRWNKAVVATGHRPGKKADERKDWVPFHPPKDDKDDDPTLETPPPRPRGPKPKPMPRPAEPITKPAAAKTPRVKPKAKVPPAPKPPVESSQKRRMEFALGKLRSAGRRVGDKQDKGKAFGKAYKQFGKHTEDLWKPGEKSKPPDSARHQAWKEFESAKPDKHIEEGLPEAMKKLAEELAKLREETAKKRRETGDSGGTTAAASGGEAPAQPGAGPRVNIRRAARPAPPRPEQPNPRGQALNALRQTQARGG